MFNSTVAAFHNMEAITVNPMFKNSSFVFCIESFKGNLNCIYTKPQCCQLYFGFYNRLTFISNFIIAQNTLSLQTYLHKKVGKRNCSSSEIPLHF